MTAGPPLDLLGLPFSAPELVATIRTMSTSARVSAWMTPASNAPLATAPPSTTAIFLD